MTIQGQAIRFVSGAAEATHLPGEIAFLARHGVPADLLREAAEIAAISGVTADQAAIKCGLVGEVAFYRALAFELDLPFREEVRIDERARYPESILAGLVPLVTSTPPYAFAPSGDALLRLLVGGSRSGLAITTPSALMRGVLNARPRAIAWHAANDLPEIRPEWSSRDGISWLQIAWATALSGSLSTCAAMAPAATLSILMTVTGLVFLGMVVLRLAAARERISTEPVLSESRLEDHDLPVYTLIVALYRERRVLAQLIEALTSLDYPGVMAQTPQA